MRTDKTEVANDEAPEAVGRRNVICRNCERRGYAMDFATNLGPHAVSEIAFPKLGSERLAVHDVYAFDWRQIGLLNQGLVNYNTIPSDDLLRLFKDSPGVEASDGVLAGRPVKTLLLPWSGGGSTRCDLDPGFGGNPVRVVSDHPDAKWRAELVASYAKYPGADVWFPKTLTRTVHDRGRLDRTEEVTIEAAELNADIPEAVFTYAGLGLEEGQSFAFPEIKERRDYPVWHDGKVDTVRTVGVGADEAYKAMMRVPPPAPPVPDVAPSPAWPYYAAGVLVLLAAAFVVAARRR